jgi:hypothetical protein
MKLLPYDSFQLVVDEPISQVQERLAAHVEPRNFWNFFGSSGNSFVGKIEGNSFKICRDISYRNSFLPIMCGTLEPHPSGTKISVRMRLHLLVMAFLIFWFWQAIKFVLPFTAVAFWAEIGQAAVMVGAALLMTYAGFWFEAGKSKKAFLEIYQKTEANTPLEPSR